MKETPLSNCEKDFLLKAISQRKRLDGRDGYDYRRIKIAFGIDRGCCHVELGNTKVMTQVSCEVTAPKQTRPSEGILFVNVELSPMAAPQFEAGRQSDVGVELNRLLERCLKESRCVDTESLCIMAGMKVWTIRVDIHVLNYDGNMTDAASISAIAALAHFRRPEVSVSGEDVTIHTLEEKDPVPLSVHHMPICVTFAFFNQGKYLLVDPTEKEERVMEGKMVIAMNKHREICLLQMTGSMLLLKDQVLRCSNIAVVKVTEVTELIHKALENDTRARQAGEKFGFAASIETKKVTAMKMDSTEAVANLDKAREDAEIVLSSGAEDFEDSSAVSSGMSASDSETSVKILAPGTGQIGEGGPTTWDLPSSSESSQEDEIVEEIKHAKELEDMKQAKRKAAERPVSPVAKELERKTDTTPEDEIQREIQHAKELAVKDKNHKHVEERPVSPVAKELEMITGELSGDSEEEEIVILQDLEPKTKQKTDSKGTNADIDLTVALKKSSTPKTGKKKKT